MSLQALLYTGLTLACSEEWLSSPVSLPTSSIYTYSFYPSYLDTTSYDSAPIATTFDSFAPSLNSASATSSYSAFATPASPYSEPTAIFGHSDTTFNSAFATPAYAESTTFWDHSYQSMPATNTLDNSASTTISRDVLHNALSFPSTSVNIYTTSTLPTYAYSSTSDTPVSTRISAVTHSNFYPSSPTFGYQDVAPQEAIAYSHDFISYGSSFPELDNPTTNNFDLNWIKEELSTKAQPTYQLDDALDYTTSTVKPLSRAEKPAVVLTNPFDIAAESAQDVEPIAKNINLFDTGVIRKFNFVISSSDKNKLDSDPSAEAYVPCDVIVDYGSSSQTNYHNAGCRYKGSLGSLLMCLDPKTKKPNGGCRKLSWKVDSNKFRDDRQKIGGQKKLNFHGMAVDLALMSERIAYDMYDQLEIASPRSSFAEIYINGVHHGLYSLVENIDRRFAKKHLKKGDMNKGKGGIYKDLWIIDEAYEKLEEYHSDGRNETKFLNEVFSAVKAVKEEGVMELLEKYFDTESIVDVTALNTLMGQTDDWRLRHNFAWYIKKSKKDGQKRLVMVPWDFDRINDGAARDYRASLGNWYALNDVQEARCTFALRTPEEQAASYSASERAIKIETYKRYPPRYGVPIQCDKITQVFAIGLRDRVKQRIIDLDVALPLSYVNEKIDEVATQIKPLVERDPAWPNVEQWMQSYEGLKTFFKESRAQALEQALEFDSEIRFGVLALGLKLF